MATITKEFLVATSPEKVWNALRDFHAVHLRVAPGFLTAATPDSDDRILTFFNGLVARERLIGRDDASRRIAYSIVEGRFTHHNASTQVFPHEQGSRIVWIADILPDTLAESVSLMMDRGADVMMRTLAE
jgi:carbon monoxide dehydrogenase subunit G